MSKEESTAERVVKHNEKSNVPEQTEVEEAESHENSQVEHHVDEEEMRRKKAGRG
jgi:hypothetical protein